MGGSTVSQIIDWFGYFIYGALAALAAWGAYNAILLHRGFKKRSLSDAAAAGLLKQIQELCQTKGGFAAAIELCRNPPYRDTALAQLIAVALEQRDKGLAKIKAMLVMEFHTEVVGRFESRLASIGTIVRMGPLLGLLGTVASMIAAFGRIGGSEQVDPKSLASDISLALWATGAGLIIANPMMVLGNAFHARLRKLRDQTERQLQEFLEILEQVEPKAAPAKGAAKARGSILTR